MLTSKQKALLGVARRQLHLTDAEYREVLRNHAGVESSRALNTDGLDKVLSALQGMGFRPACRNANYGHRAGMASPAQVSHIQSLWRGLSGNDTLDGLDAFLSNRFGVSHVRFLTGGRAQGVITALHAMRDRAR